MPVKWLLNHDDSMLNALWHGYDSEVIPPSSPEISQAMRSGFPFPNMGRWLGSAQPRDAAAMVTLIDVLEQEP